MKYYVLYRYNQSWSRIVVLVNLHYLAHGDILFVKVNDHALKNIFIIYIVGE